MAGAGAGNSAFAALLAVVMIMAGEVVATEVTAASPSPTMEAGAASMTVVLSLNVALMASFIPFLASRFY